MLRVMRFVVKNRAGWLGLYLVACGGVSRSGLHDVGDGALTESNGSGSSSDPMSTRMAPAPLAEATLGSRASSSMESSAPEPAPLPESTELPEGSLSSEAAPASPSETAATDPAAPTPTSDEPLLPDDAPTVTISFTFDDTYAAQVGAAAILEAHGLRGTFYVNSPQLHRAAANLGNPDRGSMSIAEVLDMQARGHDIGGHTLGHLSLTDVPEAERVREILGDRAQLLQLGIEARSFAYPYGHVENDDAALGESVLELTRSSGYASGRDTNGFVLNDCESRGPESLPPADPFVVRSVRSVNEPGEGEALRTPEDTADTLLGWIAQTAACGGGWLPLVFHHLAADCSDESYCFRFDELDRLAAALEASVQCPDADADACFRVQVATVSDAIGVTELAPAPEVPGLRNASLERALDSGQTECIRRTGASDEAVFGRSELANTGEFSERLELTAFEATAEIGVERDYGECAIFATEERSYELSLHYRAEPGGEAPTLRFVTYRLTADYDWLLWESGNAFSARDPGDWVRLDFATEAVPPDTIAISFGLRLESPGAINVDDLDGAPLAGGD
jgi:peptidoglycan/xylan/chitin deacetylase (PgdA/CDA1 family)